VKGLPSAVGPPGGRRACGKPGALHAGHERSGGRFPAREGIDARLQSGQFLLGGGIQQPGEIGFSDEKGSLGILPQGFQHLVMPGGEGGGFFAIGGGGGLARREGGQGGLRELLQGLHLLSQRLIRNDAALCLRPGHSGAQAGKHRRVFSPFEGGGPAVQEVRVQTLLPGEGGLIEGQFVVAQHHHPGGGQRIGGGVLQRLAPQRGGPRLGPFFDLVLLGGETLRPLSMSIHDGRGCQHPRGPLGTMIGGGQGIVIPCRDGIELVIVAPGAGDRQAEDATGERVHAVLQFIGLGLGLACGAFAELGSHALESEAREPRRVIRDRPREEITRDLQPDEVVVGKVVVEGLHDPVAVAEGGGRRREERIALVVRIAGHIQPVAAPALAVVG
jgi:hypothetical protein